MKTLLLTLASFFLLVQLSAKDLGIKDSVGIINVNGKPYLRHMVTPGETIYGISTKYKVVVTDLLELNPQLENGLKVGQEISIPYDSKLNLTQNTQQEEEGKAYHVVEAGETFYSLARKYNISVGELLKLNDIELKVGQKVVINQKKASSKESLNVVQTPVQNPVTSEVIDDKVVVKNEPTIKREVQNDTVRTNPYYNATKRILVIPFDPYLYFSDADEEIAAMSKMERTKVRQAFRKRLNALLEPSGYETIHLLGGRIKDSLTDLNKVYSSVSYSYQDLLYNPNAQAARTTNENGQVKVANNDGGNKTFNGDPMNTSRASLAKDQNKYFGVKIKDPNFFNYFNNKYKIDYYIFVNQFEVKTNYETCLDRARQNYERNFVTHFSIFDASGKQIAGNRIKINYESNENRIQKILTDNMQKVADRIIGELPATK